MNRIPHVILSFALCLAVFLLASCGTNSTAHSSIKAYLEALAAKNSDQLSNLSCADWESQAKTELESFGAVSVTLDNPSCQDTGTDGDYTLVTCTGKIIANYGNEVLEIDLSERTYLAINEGGEWRMCGYR
jgi:hypothetical protein